MQRARAPEVSVVIPTRNRWRLLARALACVQRQQHVELEIVVVDDGSIDGTADRLRGFDDPRLRLVRHERSLGLSSSRNSGIAATRGTWIALLDDDDLWSPDKLARQLHAAHASRARWCYSGAAFVDLGGGLLHVAGPPAPETLLSELRGTSAIPAGASNVIVRADLLGRVGRFDESFRHFADWDLWLRLAAADRPVAVTDLLVAYVQHAGNLKLAESEVLLSELELLDRKHGLRGDAEPTRFRMLRWIGDAQWRAGHRRPAARTFARLMRSRPAPSEAVWIARRVRPRLGIAVSAGRRCDESGIAWLDELRAQERRD